MPQTKFVLQRALEAGLKPIVVINKIDKRAARPEEALKETSDLFLELAIHESQLEFPVIWAIGREGKAFKELPKGDLVGIPGNLEPLFETILAYVPEPTDSVFGPFQMLVTALDYDDYRGKYVIGRVRRGSAKPNMAVALLGVEGKNKNAMIEKAFVSLGLVREEAEEVFAGDIVALTGLDEAGINTTVCAAGSAEALPPIAISEPTLKISVGPNTSPFLGQDGKLLTSRQINERLLKELETNVSLRMEIGPAGEFILSGRGSLHLSVLLETLRREGYELEVSEPKVVTKEVAQGT